MSTQLPEQFLSVDAPREKLIVLPRDMAVVHYKIRETLREIADQRQISPADVTYAVDGYADKLLGYAVYNVERKAGARDRAADRKLAPACSSLVATS